MRHKKKKNTLVSKNSGSRLVVRNVVTSLLMFGKITTKKTLAKAASMAVDRLISKAKQYDDQRAIRYLNKFLFTEEASRKVMDVLVTRYKDRPSGFTSTKKIGFRKGDGAPRYEISLIQE
jgi:large subunit ribosomal protein L17